MKLHEEWMVQTPAVVSAVRLMMWIPSEPTVLRRVDTISNDNVRSGIDVSLLSAGDF
jgi:hypothetical protein